MIRHLSIDPVSLESFCAKWGIVRLSLFGSVLRDDFASDSDVDVLVAYEKRQAWSLWDLIDMEAELSHVLGRTAHITEETGLRNPYIRKRILGEREVVYDR